MELLISSVDLGQGEPLDRKVTQESLRFSHWGKRPKDIAFPSESTCEREQEEQLGRITGWAHLLFGERRQHAFQGKFVGTNFEEGHCHLLQQGLAVQYGHYTAEKAAARFPTQQPAKEEPYSSTAVRPGHISQGSRTQYLLLKFLLVVCNPYSRFWHDSQGIGLVRKKRN